MVKNVRRGDTVVTNGGLVGKVTKVIDDDQIEIEIADDVRIRQMRRWSTDVRAKGEPVKEEAAAELSAAGAVRHQVGRPCFISRGGRRSAIVLTALVVCLFAVPEFLPREDGAELAEMGAAPCRARASICRAARTFCSRSTPPRCARKSSRRCATTCGACCATRASAIPAWCVRGNSVEVRIREGSQFEHGARQAARTVAAARRLPRHHRPAHPRRQQ